MKEKRLNILFLSGWYPNRVSPTLGNFVEKHAEAVALHSNVAALFVCADKNCKEKFELVENTVNDVFTVNVYYKKVGHNIPVIASLQKAMRYFSAHIRGLKAINARIGRIDLVHLNILYPAGLIAFYLKKVRNIPYIITEHWTGYLPSKNIRLSGIQKMISRVIARNAACITPVSKDLRDAMINLGFTSHYEVVYNVVNTNVFYPVQTKAENRKIKFIHVSTLDDKHKNISGILRSVKNLSLKRNDFEFLFIGDGPLNKHIQTATELGIYQSFVSFEGEKTTREVAENMRDSDCFVLFSNYENLPCVLIESMASGLPVVSTDVGGIPEHISEDFGSLVSIGDEKSLTLALNNMIDNIHKNRYDIMKLKNYADAHFSYENVSRRFHEIYHRILAA